MVNTGFRRPFHGFELVDARGPEHHGRSYQSNIYETANREDS
jgi:hypothetical protein